MAKGRRGEGQREARRLDKPAKSSLGDTFSRHSLARLNTSSELLNIKGKFFVKDSSQPKRK